MPVYTYRCDNCGVQFERHQSYDDASLTRCPECKKKSLKKVISPVGVVFKGSGFYSNDHKSSPGAGSSKASKKKEGTSAESKEGKVESKESKPAEKAAESKE